MSNAPMRPFECAVRVNFIDIRLVRIAVGPATGLPPDDHPSS